jgi:hypothetical protein
MNGGSLLLIGLTGKDSLQVVSINYRCERCHQRDPFRRFWAHFSAIGRNFFLQKIARNSPKYALDSWYLLSLNAQIGVSNFFGYNSSFVN